MTETAVGRRRGSVVEGVSGYHGIRHTVTKLTGCLDRSSAGGPDLRGVLERGGRGEDDAVVPDQVDCHFVCLTHVRPVGLEGRDVRHQAAEQLFAAETQIYR